MLNDVMKRVLITVPNRCFKILGVISHTLGSENSVIIVNIVSGAFCYLKTAYFRLAMKPPLTYVMNQRDHGLS